MCCCTQIFFHCHLFLLSAVLLGSTFSNYLRIYPFCAYYIHLSTVIFSLSCSLSLRTSNPGGGRGHSGLCGCEPACGGLSVLYEASGGSLCSSFSSAVKVRALKIPRVKWIHPMCFRTLSALEAKETGSLLQIDVALYPRVHRFLWSPARQYTNSGPQFLIYPRRGKILEQL